MTEEDDGVGPIAIPEGAATESALGSLHGIVAEYLKLKLASGKATAAEVGAAITFLKNNSITADPTKNKELAELAQTLANRKRRGGLTPAEARNATDSFDRMMGGITPGGLVN
jgi:hypothetical protein